MNAYILLDHLCDLGKQDISSGQHKPTDHRLNVEQNQREMSSYGRGCEETQEDFFFGGSEGGNGGTADRVDEELITPCLIAPSHVVALPGWSLLLLDPKACPAVYEEGSQRDLYI